MVNLGLLISQSTLLELFFLVIIFLILYPFVFYPISLHIISFFYPEYTVFDKSYKPFITLIITAYNEEKVILKKLNNICSLNYPKNKIDVIICSDGSNDSTENIVNDFIKNTKLSDYSRFILFNIYDKLGKTNAQNKAVKIAKGEILVFSDANSMLEKNSISNLVNFFSDLSVGYVSGRLTYSNVDENPISSVEDKYWNFDIRIRNMESKISSIVGGNGAIYAIRKKCYFELPNLLSHDGFMPTKVFVNGFKAKFAQSSVAYEKVSNNVNDEFKRKVRMQRGQPFKKYYDFKKFNFFRYGWFSYFYFGHKYLKYILYVLHPLLFFLNYLLSFKGNFYLLIFIFHISFYLFALFELIFKTKFKIFYYPFYYSMTIFAQLLSVYNTFFRVVKPNWEKSESTRL